MSMKAFHAKRKEPDDLVTDLLQNVSISPTKKVRVGVSSFFRLDFRLSDDYLVCVLVWNLFFFLFSFLLICVFGSDDILVLLFFLPSFLLLRVAWFRSCCRLVENGKAASLEGGLPGDMS
jgi:hypothetical protein